LASFLLLGDPALTEPKPPCGRLVTGSLQRLVPLVDGALGVSLWLDA
jgi:hypothetical protein